MMSQVGILILASLVVKRFPLTFSLLLYRFEPYLLGC